jgi:hypothetical protein
MLKEKSMNMFPPYLSKFLSTLHQRLDQTVPSDELKIINFPFPPEEEEIDEKEADKAA